jgi:hypothetical protein
MFSNYSIDEIRFGSGRTQILVEFPGYGFGYRFGPQFSNFEDSSPITDTNLDVIIDCGWAMSLSHASVDTYATQGASFGSLGPRLEDAGNLKPLVESYNHPLGVSSQPKRAQH